MSLSTLRRLSIVLSCIRISLSTIAAETVAVEAISTKRVTVVATRARITTMIEISGTVVVVFAHRSASEFGLDKLVK
jgi:hypothetical protein